MHSTCLYLHIPPVYKENHFRCVVYAEWMIYSVFIRVEEILNSCALNFSAFSLIYRAAAGAQTCKLVNFVVARKLAGKNAEEFR